MCATVRVCRSNLQFIILPFSISILHTYTWLSS